MKVTGRPSVKSQESELKLTVNHDLPVISGYKNVAEISKNNVKHMQKMSPLHKAHYALPFTMLY